MNISKLVDEIFLTQKGLARPYFISVDGKSGVGKSTFAKVLGNSLSATVISGDDFYSGGVVLNAYNPKELADKCIDRRQIFLTLKELKFMKKVFFNPFDWNRFDGSLEVNKKEVNPSNFVIVEGVYSNHTDLRSIIDLSILLTISEDERKKRLLNREGTISDWCNYWSGGEDWYFENISPPDSFNPHLWIKS